MRPTVFTPATARLALERMHYDVLSHEPEVIVVQFGLNDANCWETDRGHPRVSLAAYHANLAEMVRRAVPFGVRCVYLLTSHIPVARVQPERVRRYNQAVRNVTRDFDLARLVDIEKIAENRVMTLRDGLHLNRAGHRVYLHAVRSALNVDAGNPLPA